MAIIQFNRGTTEPIGLTLGEPAWEYDDNRFYIGVTSSAVWVGAGITTGDVGLGSTNLIPTQSAVKAYVLANAGTSSTGVTSINGLTGPVTIDADTGISITSSSNVITISNSIPNPGLSLIAGVTFTSSQTYTIPTGAKLIIGNCIAAGGGGAAGGVTQSNVGFGGEGGAGGGYYVFEIDATSIGATCSVVIGLGGAGGTDTSINGTAGGISQFHNLYFAGGLGGVQAASISSGYFLGSLVRVTLFVNYFFGQGGGRIAGINSIGNPGRKGFYGGGGGGGGGANAPGGAASNRGGSGGESSNIYTTVANYVGILTAGGGTAAGSQPGSKGQDGTIYFGGAGGGGGASSGSVGSSPAFRGGDGGYPGGGGGGGGGCVTSNLTRAPGGTGGDARIMIWVYG